MLLSNFQRSSHSLRALALGTTCIVSLMGAPVFAQSTLTWDAGDGASGAPEGADGIWTNDENSTSGGTRQWQLVDTDADPATGEERNFVNGDSVIFGPQDGGGGGYNVTLDANPDIPGRFDILIVEDIEFRADNIAIVDNGFETIFITGSVDVVDENHTATFRTDTNSGESGGFTTDGLRSVGAGTLVLRDSVFGTVTNDGTGTVRIGPKFDAGSSVDALISNSGTIEVVGGDPGQTINDGNGPGLIQRRRTDLNGPPSPSPQAGAVTINGGTVNVTGGVLTGITTITTGMADADRDGISDTNDNGTPDDTSDDTAVSGTLTVSAGRAEDVINNGGTVLLEGTGEFASLVQNDGDSTINSVITGDATFAGGTLDLGDDGDIQGTLNNQQTFVYSAGSLNDVNNTGTFELNESQSITGDFDNAGGTVDATGLTDAATLTLNGDDAPNIFTNGGDIVTNGTNALTINADTIRLNDNTVFVVDLDDGSPPTTTTNLNNQVVLDGDIENNIDSGIDENYRLRGTLTNNATFTVEGVVTDPGTPDEMIVTRALDADGNTIINTGTDATFVVGTGGSIVDGGALDNNSGATFTVAEDQIADFSSVANSDENTNLNIEGTIISGVRVENMSGATLTVSDEGRVDAGINNTGALVNIEGGTIGSISNDVDRMDDNNSSNDVAGRVVSTGASVVDGQVNNEGIIDVTDGTLTVNQAIVNEQDGEITVENAAALSAASVQNQNGAEITVEDMANLTASSIVNQGNGEITVDDTAEVVSSSVTNENGATFNLDGEINAEDDEDVDFRNNNGGTVNVGSAAAAISGSIVNGGRLNISEGNSFTAAVTNNGAGMFNGVNLDGAIVGDLTNNGRLSVAAGDDDFDDLASIIGALNNGNGGLVTVGNGKTLAVTELTTISDGILNNNGTFDGDITVEGNGDLSSISGQSVFNGNLINNGSENFDAFGTINGNLTANGGTTDAGGVLTGNLTTMSGITNFDGTLNGNVFSQGGTTNLGSSSLPTGTGLGAVNISGGTVTMTDGASVGSINQSGGILSIRNDNVGDEINVDGDVQLNGRFEFDTDLDGDGGDQTSDVLNVGGILSGNVVLDFSDISNDAATVDGLTVITYEELAGFQAAVVTQAPPFSGFNYVVSDNEAGSIILRTQLEDGIPGLASAVGLIQTIGGAVVNRPTSPYVSDLATDFGDEPCGAGGWTRLSAGETSASGDFTDNNNGVTGNSPLTLSYQGLQVGGDLVCFDDRFGGDDMSFGAIVGFNNGSAENDIRRVGSDGRPTDIVLSTTKTDFDQTYAGAYITASRGRLFADVQYRLEQTNYTTSNVSAGNVQTLLDDEDFTTTGSTLSGSAGYSWSIPQIENLNFVGSFGFAYSQYETDTINIDDSTLKLDDATQELGFLSGTLSRTSVLPDNISFVNYFGTATVYQDFAEKPTATFSTDTNETPITLANLESYAEISAGVNYVRLLDPAGGALAPRQFNAALRVDGRQGEEFDSWGVTGQLRLQF